MTHQNMRPPAAATAQGPRKSDQQDSSIGSESKATHPATQAALNWRDHLAVHPAAEAFPPLSEKELKELAGDIKRNGMRFAIVLWKSPTETKAVLLDGRNRLDALALLDRIAVDKAGELCIKKADGTLRELPKQHLGVGDPERHADSFNLHRRHLKPEDKRKLIARALKATPEKSNNAVAKQLKITTDKTVGAVRRELEATSEIPKLEKTIGADKKARTSKKPADAALKRRKEKREILLVEVERLATKLIENDRGSAGTLHDILRDGDYRVTDALIGALGRGLGPDDTAPPAEPLSGDDPGPIPDCPRRDRGAQP